MSEDENAPPGKTKADPPGEENEQAANGNNGVRRASRAARLMGWLMMSHYLLVLGIPTSLIVTVTAGAETWSVTHYLFTCAVMALALAAVPPCRRMTALWAENHARVFQKMLS